MPYTPNANEIQASAFAKALDLVIDQLKSRTITNKQSIKALCENINGFLADHFTDAAWKSPYFQFLLQQCSRYNAFFHSYSYQGTEIKNTVVAEHDLSPIQCSNAKLMALQFNVGSLQNSSHFRPAHLDTSEGVTRYYYDQKHVATFITDYHAANMQIGRCTQVSNAKGGLKVVAKQMFGLFSARQIGQSHDRFFKGDSEQHHFSSKSRYAKFISCVEEGKALSDDLLSFLQDQDQHYQHPHGLGRNTEIPQVTHIGHATTLYQAGSFTMVTDPIHYQSGTDGLLAVGAAVAYPRNTEPAFRTSRYPGVHFVLITHNHHDHLCPKTLKEAYPEDTLFFVPAGVSQSLHAWGFKNVIEIPDWNYSIKIEIPGLKEYLIFHALPANHASNRGLNDYMQSLYMGCILEYVNSQGESSLTLISGDTAVLDDEHHQQLEAFIKGRKARVALACLAAGPDRPRSLMRISHGSSLDSMTLHARLTVANLMGQNVTFENLRKWCCHAVGYHQGCYRLGLLSYSDLLTTVTRVHAVLESYQQCSSHPLSIKDLFLRLQSDVEAKSNIYFSMMDLFERQGLVDLLQQYARINIVVENADNDEVAALTVKQLAQILSETYHLPKIGSTITAQSSLNPVNKPVDTMELIVNQSALQNLQNGFSYANTAADLFKQAYQQFATVSSSKDKIKKFADWLLEPKNIGLCQQLDAATESHKKSQLFHRLLSDLYQVVQGKERYDESIREEGNFETLALYIANLELKRYQMLVPSVIENERGDLAERGQTSCASSSHK